MKTIYLFRHAEPIRLLDVQDSQWPLSAHGHKLASAVFERLREKKIGRVYTSPYLRAMETARHTCLPLSVDSRLSERTTGVETPEMGDCWLRQYEDMEFKCDGGESFSEVRQRMNACLTDILADMNDGEAVVVVSHAAAICAFLMKYCCVNVTDRSTKSREIIWCGEIVYTGSLPPLTGFAMSFQGNALESIVAITG